MKFKHIFSIGFVFLILFSTYLTNMNWLEPTQIGITKNVFTGTIGIQNRAGLHLTPIYVFVARIDTRPIRVSIESDSRSASAKLVQFKSEYWQTFVKTEGWRYYWWSNRISFNLGYRVEHRGMKDVLRGYAYSNKQYPFIDIVEEL